MNISYSLHKIADQEICPFKEAEYSRFKFGDKFYAEKFAEELFDGFVDQHKDLILSDREIVILPSPYLSIPTASNFLCYYFKKELNSYLFKNGKTLRKILSFYELEDLISFQIYSDEVGYSKPNTKIFQLVFDQVNKIKETQKKEILHIGDNSIADYNGAINFGFDAHLLKI